MAKFSELSYEFQTEIFASLTLEEMTKIYDMVEPIEHLTTEEGLIANNYFEHLGLGLKKEYQGVTYFISLRDMVEYDGEWWLLPACAQY